MALHSGLSYWKALQPAAVHYPPLAGDTSCEVCIIGGGVTGALLGHLLTEAGVAALLVDKRQPAEGSTAASTGLLQFEVDTHLADLIGKVGQQRAVAAYRQGLIAIDELQGIAQQFADGCGFSRRPSYYFASNWCDYRALRREFECRREHGLPAEFLTRRQLANISSIKAAAAIRSSGDGQINPLALTQNVLAKAQQRGLQICGATAVAQLDERSHECLVQTSHGRVSAKAVVIATGYEAHQLLQRPPGDLQSTYVVTSEPVRQDEGWPEKSLLWETTRPYFYARQTDDSRLMIGGGDTAFADDHRRDALVVRKVNQLITRFGKLFPKINFVPEYAWAGTFAETKDGLAYIGRLPGRSRTYCALGYGGNGITFSMIAARLITDIYLGRKNPNEEVFSFSR
jgi:glycine/D-amino acid oxidase-like deaminating enzyme